MKLVVRVVQALAVVGAVVFVVMLFANEPEDVDTGGGDEVAEEAADEGGNDAEPVDGAAVFADRCASCHGSDGSGRNGPQLSDGRVVERFPDVADQIEIVTDGSGAMPSFDGRLSAEEIEAVVEYTRTL
jgi:mono/diheme cytochrome c family protein